jgi:hypothetical protein
VPSLHPDNLARSIDGDDRAEAGRVTDFTARYREAFANLGRPLSPSDGILDASIAAGARRVGGPVPKALTDYLGVAGNSDDVSCHELREPDDWEVEDGYLVFMADEDSRFVWGISERAGDEDPPVFQSTTTCPLFWERVHPRCSEFLLVMLHWDAAYGRVMAHCASAPSTLAHFEMLDRDWSLVGEIRGMRAYRRHGQVACSVEWGEDNWMIFAGATDAEGLDSIAAELGLTWE